MAMTRRRPPSATYKWTSLAPYGLSFEKENNTMKRTPLTFTVEHLKDIMRDYCIAESGEVGPEVSNMYVTIGDEDSDEGIPTNFTTLTIEFADDDE
jgi:hypothetical protein